MECIQDEKSLKYRHKETEWRLNHMFSEHKPGLLLYGYMKGKNKNCKKIKMVTGCHGN